MTTDLIIIGAGAGGLMAAAAAGEAGLKCMLVERRHRPGLKLLMCGNNRCNISHNGSVEELIQAYGPEIGEFLRPALENFSPEKLRSWFRERMLSTTVLKNRIYPRSEKADDVLHVFTDALRDLEVPVLYNTAVQKIYHDGGLFTLDCGAVTLQSRYILMATGGLSYPKTGSVGDGQRMASALGHGIEECRSGLAGIDINEPLHLARTAPDGRPLNLPEVKIRIRCGDKVIGVTEGNLLVDRMELRGTAVFDAVRLVSRGRYETFTFSIEGLGGADDPLNLELSQQSIRPVKEAILTMGGVNRSEINPETMESTRVPGLYFAGEVMDIDGPTGGYNLHAAFSTARLAVKGIALSRRSQPRNDFSSGESGHYERKGKGSYHENSSRKSSWGKDFWSSPRTGRRPAPQDHEEKHLNSHRNRNSSRKNKA